MKKNKKKLLWTFAIASFLNDFGSDMIYPVWPLFVTSFLGANMAVLGFIDGLGEAIVSLAQAASGYFSDRTGRKLVLMLSFVFRALVCLSFILVHTRLTIILSFVFYGLHKGALEPVQKTLVAELAPVS